MTIPGFGTGERLTGLPVPKRRARPADKTAVQMLEKNRIEIATWFADRRWRICTELNGHAELPVSPDHTAAGRRRWRLPTW